MGRPPRFAREELEAAALAIVDDHGVEGLTMRSLAGALGTGAMTLYNYVDDRSALDALVVDAVLRDVAWQGVPHERWRDDVHAIGGAVWRAVRPHPHVVPLILSRQSRSAVFLDVAEALLTALQRTGRSGLDLLVAFRAVATFVTGITQAEITGRLSTASGEPAEVIEEFRRLPAERYPRLIEIAGAAASSDPNVEFHRGLDLILDGVEAGR